MMGPSQSASPPRITAVDAARGLASVALVLLGSSCGIDPLPATGTLSTERFDSTVVDDQYLLRIRLPPDYDPNSSVGYPLIVQLDPTHLGGEQYAITVGLISDYAGNGDWDEAIVVGVDYPSDPSLRDRDYLPPEPPNPDEPIFLAPWLEPSQVDGATHRTVLVAHLGHSVHLGKRRRFALGLHGYGGWNYWRSAYSVDYAAEDVSGSAVVDDHLAVVGGELRLGYRFHRRVGANLVMGAPFPTASSYAITFAHVGLGLSFFLR